MGDSGPITQYVAEYVLSKHKVPSSSLGGASFFLLFFQLTFFFGEGLHWPIRPIIHHTS